MKNKGVLFRRIIYCVCVILSLVFITFKGGNLPYMLFSMMLINTIVSIVYIIYVFYSIRIYQIVSERRVTKQDFVPYELKLNNESVIAYRDVSLQYLDQLSQVKGIDKKLCVGLEPGESFNETGELYCKYSGTYYVGVDAIEIMDYFKIFRIHFQMPQKMRVTVMPRVLELQNISFVLEEESHNSSIKGNDSCQLDNEVRKYSSSDNKKWIHWRNSAKRQELMVRNMETEELSEYVVIMDGSVKDAEGRADNKPANRTMDKKTEDIIRHDKLREGTVALVNSFYRSGYYVLAVLDEIYEKEVSSQRDFREFFERMIDYGFGRQQAPDEKIRQLNRVYDRNVPFIIVSSERSALDWGALGEVWNYRAVKFFNVDMFDSVEDMFNM